MVLLVGAVIGSDERVAVLGYQLSLASTFSTRDSPKLLLVTMIYEMIKYVANLCIAVNYEL
jgi:hypothetical protein